MSIEIRRVDPADADVLRHVADDVFDADVDPVWTSDFLSDPRHHLVVAVDDGVVVGFASGVHYVHPDKPAELWINEVGVAPAHHRRGIGRALMDALLAHGRSLGCVTAWVLTEQDNAAAQALYRSVGGRRVEPDPVLFEMSLAPEGPT